MKNQTKNNKQGGCASVTHINQTDMETTNIYFKSKGLYYYHMAIPEGSISVTEHSVNVYSIPVNAGINIELEPISREEFLNAYTKTLAHINNLLNQ